MSVKAMMLPVRADEQAQYRYFDPRHGKGAVRILPNEYAVSGDDVVLTTVLGSCVSACVRDPVAGVGGMNHFMLPVAGPDVAQVESRSMRYGANAMAALLEALYARGARHERLEIKVFGGAALLTDVTGARIGEANARFVLDYLSRQGLAVRAQDLNDRFARQLHYFPQTGQARVKRLSGYGKRLVQHDRLLADTLAQTLPVLEFAGPCAVDINRRRQEQIA